jgi:transmembrane sensor
MIPSGDDERGEEPAIEAEAMAWLAERDEGFGPGRAEAFSAWIRRDQRHQAAVAELEQVLGQLQRLAERRDEVNAHFGRVPPAGPAAAPVSRTAAWWRPAAWIGAAAALAVGAFLGFRPDPSAAAAGILHATTSAGYERSRLADGSMLELNHSSSARVRFSDGERRVELESGEAHFEVAHDTARPFVVQAAGVAVRAVGTAFNVRHVPGAVEVTVTEGRVAIGGPAAADGAAPLTLAAQERMVIPVVAASLVAVPPVVERLAAAEVRTVLAWQRRVTDFSDTPLAEVVARFNRHHSLQLVVDDPALGARRIGGLFALDDVEAFVRLLERDGIIRAEREGGIVYLRAP